VLLSATLVFPRSIEPGAQGQIAGANRSFIEAIRLFEEPGGPAVSLASTAEGLTLFQYG
jgi:hypothetical protein